MVFGRLRGNVSSNSFYRASYILVVELFFYLVLWRTLLLSIVPQKRWYSIFYIYRPHKPQTRIIISLKAVETSGSPKHLATSESFLKTLKGSFKPFITKPHQTTQEITYRMQLLIKNVLLCSIRSALLQAISFGFKGFPSICQALRRKLDSFQSKWRFSCQCLLSCLLEWKIIPLTKSCKRKRNTQKEGRNHCFSFIAA